MARKSNGELRREAELTQARRKTQERGIAKVLILSDPDRRQPTRVARERPTSQSSWLRPWSR